jgi:hypothetical protein
MTKEIKVITQRDVILGVRAQWLSQYAAYDPKQEIGARGAREAVGVITKRVKALDLKTCSVADVDKAIGTTGWADNECDVCGKAHDKVVRIGDEPDHDARWVDVCKACLAEASALLLHNRGGQHEV